MHMYERRQKILEILLDHSPVQIETLAQQLDATPVTIRRDLASLEQDGLIIRSRGIARLNSTPFYVKSPDIPVRLNEKKAIAKAAAGMIPHGSSVILDSGTTTLVLAELLTERKDITLITNSITVANVMASTNVSTIVVGGNLFGDFHALVGPETEEYFSNITADILFLATTGIRKDELTTMTPFQNSLKRKMVQCAQKVILLADESKFNVKGLRGFARFSDIDCLVTSAPIADPQTLEMLRQNDVEVVIAQP